MTRVAERDTYGLRRIYYRLDGSGHGPRIADLLTTGARLDHQGVLGYLARRPLADRTCFAGVAQVPPGYQLCRDAHGHFRSIPASPLPSVEAPLLDLLSAALERMATDQTALALSGGFDSALLLALWLRNPRLPPVRAYTLVSGIPGYCEARSTQRVAQHFGVPLTCVEVTASDLVAALPQAVAAAETSFYNLHMVSKFLLARALAADGIRHVITGDGADQVLACAGPRSTANYLPWVDALSRCHGIEVRAPFLCPRFIARARAEGADPGKKRLRKAARRLLPRPVIDGQKRPRLTPTLDLSPLEPKRRIARLQRDIPYLRPVPTSDPRLELQLLGVQLLREQVLWRDGQGQERYGLVPGQAVAGETSPSPENQPHTE